MKEVMKRMRIHEKLVSILDSTLEYTRTERIAAVLVPVMIDDSGEVFLVMIKRKMTLTRSAGHIAFPGGMRDEGESPVDTALREAEEEIGIDRDLVDVVGFLSPKEVVEHRIKIHPVVGVFERVELRKNEDEVEKILIDGFERVLKSRRIADWGPNFECAGELVWGASSRILDDLYMRIVEKHGSIERFFHEL